MGVNLPARLGAYFCMVVRGGERPRLLEPARLPDYDALFGVDFDPRPDPGALSTPTTAEGK